MASSFFLSDHERLLLELELNRLTQSSNNRNNFSQFSSAVPSMTSYNSAMPSGTSNLFLGSSSAFPGIVGPSSSSSLDSAAALLLARSQSISGSGLAAALRLNSGGSSSSSLLAPSTNSSLRFAAAAPTMTSPSLEDLQRDCRRAEQELKERRQLLALQMGQQGQQQGNTNRASPSLQDLQNLLLLQKAAEARGNSSAMSSSQQSSESNRMQYHRKETPPPTSETRVSSYSPIRKKTVPVQQQQQHSKKPKVAKKQEPSVKKNKAKWNSYFDALKEYKAEYGDTSVPRGHSENPRLASWVSGKNSYCCPPFLKQPRSPHTVIIFINVLITGRGTAQTVQTLSNWKAQFHHGRAHQAPQ